MSCSSPHCTAPAVTYTADSTPVCSACAVAAYRAAAADESADPDGAEPADPEPLDEPQPPTAEPAAEPPREPLAPAWQLPPAFAALLGPRLPSRPACAGLAPLHDAELPGELKAQREQRHARALEVCATCRCRTACREAVESLPRAAGVWAGELLGMSTQREQARSDAS